VPKEKRVHGYYAMPILAGGELVGAVDPAKERGTLVIRHVSLESPRHAAKCATALRGAAAWIGAETIRLERVTPEAARAPLVAALASTYALTGGESS
jgi:uncharacterized protein YcaQ